MGQEAVIKGWRQPQRTMRRPAVDYEGQEQAALFNWLRLRYPEAARIAYHVPNGGHRVKAVAAKMKAQGVKAGVSDICLPMARGGYFGLYIEFKATPPHDSAVSANQNAFLLGVEREGYMATVCRGINDAMGVLDNYLALPKTLAVRQ